MARARVSLFPQPKQQRASNNVQPVFGKVDPFRRQPQGTTAGPLNLGATGGVATTADTIPGDIPPKQMAERILQAEAGLIPGQTGGPALTSLDALRLLQGFPLGTQPATSAPGTPTPTSEFTAGIARELSGTLAGNPFISQEGKARLSQGLSPLLSDIQSAFFRQTEPNIVQRLMALLQSSGLPAADVAHTIEAGRPRGLR